ncbi:type II toxin-antitoxin system RelE/ParE family toxin [Corynebacterium nasicanis]|uniref:Type II toxin-antitoxin system RelE/ParE family toxin n=1 Tax=Corynebacterium nasicanis TaxID=1448267 RepID=A0ABW1QAU5_9CORY
MELIARDPSYKAARWGAEVIKSSADERDLRAMKSLHLEKLSGDRAGTFSIRLNRKYRLILRFDTDEVGRLVVILEMLDYHR